jgi:hypothetical protein
MERTSKFMAIARRYGFLLLLLTVPLLIAAENGFLTWEEYNAEADSIAGIWISSQQNSPEDNPWIWTETLTPLDDTGTRYAYRAWSPNPGVNYDWLELTESRVSEDHAHAQLQWVWYWIGTATISEDGTLLKDGMWQLYNSIDVLDPLINDKDADDDGFPDEGVVPLLCGPWPMESKRVQLQPQAVKEEADFYY